MRAAGAAAVAAAVGAWGAAVAGVGPAAAQEAGPRPAAAAARDFGPATHVVVPQSRAFALEAARSAVEIESVQVAARILEQTATTTVEVALRNAGPRQEEAVLLLPVPEGAAVSAFAFEGPAREPTARLLSRDEARRTYDDIVRRVRDPALLEFAGWRLVRSSVFPVPASGRQRVRLTYEHVLDADGARVDYAVPRSESLAAHVPWRVAVDICSKSPISTVYSPSHAVTSNRLAPCHVHVLLTERADSEPGPFLLSYLAEREDVTASLFAYPDPAAGGGYFLLLAGLPAAGEGAPPAGPRPMPREVTLVLDRSGSMAGGKLDQVRRAAHEVVEGLAPGETFNVIDYGTTVERFAAAAVERNERSLADAEAYLASLRPGGGTNLHDALVEALRQPASPGRLPLVLFLTDGLPTVGHTEERAIRDAAAAANPGGRRIFTLGVGTDVNAPLLDRLAEASRATSDYVLPGEDVAAKVAQVARRTRGPVLAGPRLEVLDAEEHATTRRVRDLTPAVLPDLFEGDRIVLLGRYVGGEPLHFRLSGDWRGAPRTFEFRLGVAQATTRNAFVPRLWASRRIATLVDEVRQAGADAAVVPRLRELTDEIVRLSTEFGVLTEYTAFLATEGTDLSDWDHLLRNCAENLDGRAAKTRSGAGGVNQAANITGGKRQTRLNHSNGYLDDKLSRVEIGAVRQVSDRAFFRRGGVWVDSRLVAGKAPLAPPREVALGTDAHAEVLRTLEAEGRAAVLSLPGDVLVRVGEENVLVRNGGTE